LGTRSSRLLNYTYLAYMFILYAHVERHMQGTRKDHMSSGYQHLTNMFVYARIETETGEHGFRYQTVPIYTQVLRYPIQY